MKGAMDVTSVDLDTHTRHVERLFILGAGFSRSVSEDFPITRDLLEAIFDEDPKAAEAWAAQSSSFAPFLRVRETTGVPEITNVLTVLEAYRATVRNAGIRDSQIRELQTRVLYAAARLLHRVSLKAAKADALKKLWRG
jgi:hypothetical protein